MAAADEVETGGDAEGPRVEVAVEVAWIDRWVVNGAALVDEVNAVLGVAVVDAVEAVLGAAEVTG